MAAFEPICSGFPEMDRALDHIRLGDNVVWQVSELEEFRIVARAFARQAIRDGRNLIYIRFADHEPILPPMEGLKIIPVKLSHRFETFTIHIHNLIEKEGFDAFYVFDCLSELEEAWATDLMMGNFFHLTCPFLFQLDTVAYFPVIRGRHSFAAIEKIRDTTQLLLDVLPDGGAERALRESGMPRDVFYVSCDGLVRNEALMEDMRGLLRLLQTAYDYPVDIEYTINLSPAGEYLIDLLQCRPLQLTQEGETVTVPAADRHSVLLETKGVSMGFSRKFAVDVLVYIDAIAYYQMPYREKHKVKNALSAVNWKCRDKQKRLVLLTPGRICTSSPELGVPSTFADISEFDAIIEVSEKRAGYMPELSYGSHIFQDLVEAGILYSAVFEGKSTVLFRPELLTEGENRLSEYAGPAPELSGVVHVSHTDGRVTLYYDMATEHLLIAKE